MTDGRRDADLEASARARTMDEYRRNAELRREQGVTLGRPRGVLTEESAAERRQLAEESSAASSAQANVVVPAAAPADGEAAFRHARLAVVAALVLALALVWLMQRRARRGG